MGIEDAKRGRKRAVADHEAAKPPAKRPAIAGDSSAPEQQERVRSDVRALLESYNALINRRGGAVDSGAFQALLKAAQGDVASQRLAARLVPRFIALFPDQVEVAASALIKLSERYQEQDGSDQPLEEHTRRDALHGLQAVLLAASAGTPHGSQAVKLILTVLFRLLSQAEAEAPSTEEPEEEEGEVAAADGQAAAAAAAGPWVRKVLRQSLQHHPIATLTFCFGCIGASTRNSSSSSAVNLGVVQGVRLWLREHILREATPSREGTPIDCDAATPRAAGAAAAAARGCASLAAAAAAGAAGVVNGAKAPKAAALATAAAGCANSRGCVLQSVLASSADLRAWVRREAKGLSRAPDEVKAVLQAAVQLMPPERPSSKRPSPTDSPQQQQQQRPAPFGNQAAGGSRPQQPPQFQQPSPPQQQQQQPPQHKAPNGVAPRQVNGMEPIGRSWSTPSPSGRGPRGRTALGRPPDPAAAAAAGASWGQFPRPAGPICLLEPCVLLTNVPWHLKQQDLQQQLPAAEVWILDTQPPVGPGSSSSRGARACCVLKAPLDAARAYMRHHKNNRLAPQCPPVQVSFASSLPACSRAAAAAAAAPSVYVWALRAVAGDAEKVTDDLRVSGLIPKSVSRVNHGADPGTVLEAHSAKDASDILAFLLKTHSTAIAAAAAAAAAQQQQPQEELPPLPPEPPPGDWTPAGNRSGKPPSTPAAAAAGGGGGGGPPRQQHQQQGPSPLGGPGGPSPLQQQQGGYGHPGVRRTSSLPVGGGTPAGPPPGSNSKFEGGWRQGGPGHGNQGGWGTPGPGQQQWGPPGSQQQQQWGPGTSPGQGPPGNEAGGRPGWQHGTPPHHHIQQQQQQGRRPPGGAGQPGGSGGGAQGMPPFPGPPLAPPQQQQQQQGLQRQHSYAGASPSSSTPSHAGSPAGPGQVPPLPLGQVPPGPLGQMQQQYAGAQVLWRGRLFKSEISVGTVCCIEAIPGAHRQPGSAPEPRHWPDALHINHRTKVSEALDQYVVAAPHLRAVRVLVPQESPAGNVQAIQHFVQYLTNKNRAGMVKLPAAHGLAPRAVYLIVPEPEVCQTLQVPWDGRCVMLIVVVVPHIPGSGGGGSSGGGAGGPKGGPPIGPTPGHYPPGHHAGHRPMR